jgi:hypothetical protein
MLSFGDTGMLIEIETQKGHGPMETPAETVSCVARESPPSVVPTNALSLLYWTQPEMSGTNGIRPQETLILEVELAEKTKPRAES